MQTALLIDKERSVLRRVLRGKELFAVALGSMIGAGWVVVINDWLKDGGPGGAILAFVTGGLMILPIGFVYGRLTQKIPDSGGELAFTSHKLPPVLSFTVSWSMVLTYLIVCPYEAVAVGHLAGQMIPVLKSFKMYSIAGQPIYLPQLLLGLLITAIIAIINHLGAKFSTSFQKALTYILLAMFLVFCLLGFFRAVPGNASPLFAQGNGFGGIATSILLVVQIVPYFLVGFETISKCPEEAAIDFNKHAYVFIPLLAIIVATVFYAAIIAVVATLQPWKSLLPDTLATAVAFEKAFDSRIIANTVIVVAILSLLKVFNGCFFATSRLLFAMGRRRLLPPVLGQVHNRYDTPTFPIVLVAVATMIASIFGKAVLIPIATVGSFTCAIGWLATCIVFCCGAGDAVSPKSFWIGLLGATVAAVLILIKLIPSIPGSFGLSELIVLVLWLVAGGILWMRFRKPCNEN